MKICIDAGHNDKGWDTGAEGNGLREQDITFEVAHRLAGVLQSAGIEVLETRPEKSVCLGSDLNSSLQKRCDISNQWGADYFVSVHCNSFSQPTPRGTEVYIVAKGGKAEELAGKVQQSIVEQVGTRDRGVKVQNLKVLRSTDAPAILIELAYICTPEDAQLLKNKQTEFAAAIADGILAQLGKTEEAPLTVQKLDNIYIQEIYPPNFEIKVCDCAKRNVGEANYFNLGFFANTKESTIAIGNLAVNGEIISQAKDNADWINVAGQQLTTIYVKQDGKFGVIKTDDLSYLENMKTAVSGIPIVLDGKVVTMEQIKEEGYFGNEIYKTWHGFLGIRGSDLVYAAFQADFEQMAWILIALGIRTAIKLDGGGSFILHNGKELAGTSENRRIHNIGIWKG